jgi:carbon-monoxide dehydrogenase large subunit
MTPPHVGEPLRRVEDPAVLRGEARFLDDMPADGALHLVVVRSAEAHALVRSVDVEEARAGPGVAAVVTAGDLGARNGPFAHPTWFPADDPIAPFVEEMRPEELSVLAAGRVLYAGQPVAAVIATSPAAAVDAAELVVVEYDPLEVVSDVVAALAPGAPTVREGWPDNVSTRFALRKGDPGSASAAAAVVVRDTFRLGRQTGAPIEPRGALAVPDGDGLTVWSSTQAPHWLRDALVTWTGLAQTAIRVIAPSVGGGFGIKSMVYPEELLVSLVALRLGRAVKWVETRSEHFLAAVHARDQHHDISLALDADGRILAVTDDFVVDVGAGNVEGLVVPYNTAAHLQGAYRVPALDLRCTCVVTNKSPLSSYRGAGRPEAVFAMERILDRAAAALSMDPLDLRIRNLVPAAEMPFDAGILYRDGNRLVLDAGDVPGALRIAAERADYDGWRQRQAELLGEGRHVGIGAATYVEGTGIGPGDSAEVVLDAAGAVTVFVAPPSQGQGHATTLGQICAAALGVELAHVRVVQGDTADIASGSGTIASRTAVVVGNAVARAAHDLRERLLGIGAVRLECATQDLELADGRVVVRGSPSASLSLADLAASSPDPLVGRGEFSPPGVTFASGAHVAVVEADPWTGVVRVLRYVAVHDCGTVINPTVVDGQVTGGVAQGVGGALFEELVYDAAGQLVTGSFMDYLLPRATDLCDIEVHHLETPSSRNPLGIKGCGEAGTVAPPAAIAGAVEDALRGLGARVTSCPLTPWVVASLVDEGVLAALGPPRVAPLAAAATPRPPG